MVIYLFGLFQYLCVARLLVSDQPCEARSSKPFLLLMCICLRRVVFVGLSDLQAVHIHRGRENTDTNYNQERRVSTKQSSHMQMHTIFIELLLDLITCAKEQNRPTTESAKGQTKATTLTITAGQTHTRVDLL